MLYPHACDKYAVDREPIVITSGAEQDGEELTNEQLKAIAASCGTTLLILGT